MTQLSQTTIGSFATVAHVIDDPRVKHELEPPVPFAGSRVALALAILLVILPALSLPSRIGIVPYAYPRAFIHSSEFLRYCICLVGSWLTFLPAKPPWDLPVPKVVGAGWQVTTAVAFVALVWAGVRLLKDGWAAALKNREQAKKQGPGH